MSGTQPYLQKNLQALAAIQPAVAHAIANAPDWSSHLHEASDGGYSVRAAGDSGAWVQSRRGPINEGQRLASRLELKFLESVMVVGSGLGYAVAPLLARSEQPCVVVFEQSLPLLRLMLGLHDFTKHIEVNLLKIAVDVPGEPIAQGLMPIGEHVATFGFQWLHHTYTANDERYAHVKPVFADWLHTVNIRVQTKMAGSLNTWRNLFDNFGTHLKNTGRTKFKNILKNVPAVLCAAGPSLQENLKILKPHSKGYFVLAVSTALKRVLAEGIHVDLTNCVDYSHLSQRYFRDLSQQVPLWASPASHPSVLEGYDGPVLTDERREYQQLFSDGEVPDHGEPAFDGTNVAHHALDLLIYFGCDPIIFCGLDQAFSYHVSHVPGAATYDEASGAASRFTSLYMKDLIFVTARDERVDAGTDVHGNPLLTDRQMHESAMTFERQIQLSPGRRFMNCTGAGRRLNGAEDLELASIVEECSASDVPREAFESAVRESINEKVELLEAGEVTLKKLLSYSEQLRDSLRKANKALRKAEKKISEKGETGDLSALSDLNSVIAKRKGVHETAQSLASADLMERRRLKQQAEDPRLTKIEKVRLQVQAERSYTEAFDEAMTRWIGLVERGRGSLERAREGRAIASSKSAPKRTIGRERKVSSFVEIPGDPEWRGAWYSCGDHSPLKFALENLLAEERIDEIVVPRWPRDPELPISHASIREMPMQPSQCTRSHNPIGERLMRFNHVSTIYGPLMCSYVALHADAPTILQAFAERQPDYLLVVPAETGFLTSEAIAAMLDDAIANQWQRPLFLAEGPRGLFPTLWEWESIELVAQEGNKNHMVYWQQEHFWGPSFVHQPSVVRACHRNFSTESLRGREFCHAIASRLGDARGVRDIVEVADAAGNAWAGELPRDLEVEITAHRSIEPKWLPKLTRERSVMSLSEFESILNQLGDAAASTTLTLGGHGDPLEHLKVADFVHAAHGRVASINLRSFGLQLSPTLFEELALAGLDFLTVRFGAWGPGAYRELNDSDAFEKVSSTLLHIANRRLQQQQQLPLIVPEVVKCRVGDETLIQFRDAWWSPATFPLVTPFSDFDGDVEADTAVRLHPGIRKAPFRLWEQLVVHADQNVPQSIYDANATQGVGSLKTQSLQEIWQGEALNTLRRRYLDQDPELSDTSLARDWFDLT